MWMEINSGSVGVGCILIGLMTALASFVTNISPQTRGFSILFLPIGFIAIGILIGGNYLLKSKIVEFDLVPLLEKLNAGTHELAVFITGGEHGGLVRFFPVKKEAYKHRTFKYLKKDATIINTGKYPLRTLNGNSGFLCHEDYNEDIDPHDLIYAEKLQEKFDDTDIKNIARYLKIKEKEKEDGEGHT